MDVRCNKCDTEYELDESRLKPGGVTVKCTTCGNLFRVRPRASTAVGMGVVQPPSSVEPAEPETNTSNMSAAGQNRAKTASGRMTKAESERLLANMAPAPKTPMAAPMAAPASATAADASDDESKSGKERKWLIRLPTGQVEACHELATLQQWIISGRVSRNSGISRTGKTWKKLGDIGELASFFKIAEDARSVREERSVAMPMPTPPQSGSPIQSPMPSTIQPTIKPTIKPTGVPRAPKLPARQSAPASVPSPIGMAEPTQPMLVTRQPMVEAVAVQQVSVADPAVAEGDAAFTSGRSPRESSDWAKAALDTEQGSQGPKGGMARGVPTMDVAFGKSRIRPLHEHDGEAEEFPDLYDRLPDSVDNMPTGGGGVGRWIVAISLLVMAGAAVAIYMLVFRAPTDGKSTNVPGEPVAVLASDAGVPSTTSGVSDPVVAAKDAGVADTTPPESADASREDVLADADASILGFDKQALETAETRLAALVDADKDMAVVIARARVQAALAQHALDDAAFSTDKAEAKELEREAERRVLSALSFTKKALESDRKSVSGNALMADIMRLQGKNSRTVDRYLRVVRKAERKSREADLIQALGYVDDKRPKKGRPMLEKLERGAGAMEQSHDIRPTYRIALLDLTAENHEDARRRLNDILALVPEHASASALLARIRKATEVDTSDPLPPEDGSHGSSGDSDGDGDGSYDSLLARADKKAENGDCNTALDLYEKAVDINPLGVAALTGMGYCYMDRGRFDNAHAKFKAALVASPSYQEALWGIAEAYQQEGKKAQAIEAFQKFLSAHPNGSRSDMARRQIERLGGTVGGADDTGDNKTGTGTGDGEADTGTGDGEADTGSGPDKPADKPADTGGVDKPADTGGADKPADTGGADKPADTGEADKPASQPTSAGPSGDGAETTGAETTDAETTDS